MTKIILLTGFALVAFAFNSILCRLALKTDEIDAAGFTAVRLISGAITLIAISYFFSKEKNRRNVGIGSPRFFFLLMRFVFRLYIDLTTGTGALILFGCVQATMIVAAIVKGERPKTIEWIGLLAALGGLVYLVFPGLTSPPLLSSTLMAFAGIAWGFYTLRGTGSTDPLADTTGNFVRSVPMMVVVSLPFLSQIHLSPRGILLAVISGGVASGIGYTVWYAALKHLTSTRAAVVQLAVPVLAATGGVFLLAEFATARLFIAAALILGGITLTIFGRKH